MRKGCISTKRIDIYIFIYFWSTRRKIFLTLTLTSITIAKHVRTLFHNNMNQMLDEEAIKVDEENGRRKDFSNRRLSTKGTVAVERISEERRWTDLFPQCSTFWSGACTIVLVLVLFFVIVFAVTNTVHIWLRNKKTATGTSTTIHSYFFRYWQ